MGKINTKLLFVVGIMGIVISIIFLITQNSKTKKNTNLDIINEKEKNIINKNNGSLSLSTNNTETGKTNKLITTETGNKQNIEFDYIKGSNSVIMLLPGFFFNDSFIEFSKYLYNQKDIALKLQTIVSYQEYKSIVSDPNKINDIDIFLVPFDWIDDFDYKPQKIEMREDVKPFVNEVFYSSVDGNFTFLPFAIDPFVLYEDKDVNLKDSTINSILTYVGKFKEKKKLDIPFLFGISTKDIKLLLLEHESFPNYYDFFYNLFYQLVQFGGQDEFDYFSKIFKNKKAYDYNWMIDLVEKINFRNNYCDLFPSICLYSYDFADLRLGFFSDILIWKKYFSNSSKKYKDINIKKFPQYNDVYKVRLWGFIIKSSLPDKQVIKDIIQEFIIASNNKKYEFWTNSISAYNSVYNLQKFNNKYSEIWEIENMFSLYDPNIDNLIRNKQILNFIQGKIDGKSFLEEFNLSNW